MISMKQFSEETRNKMSESAKKRCSDPKWLENQHNRGTKLTRIHPERKIKHNPDPLHPDEIEMCLTCEKKTCRGCENKFREMRKTT